MIAWNRGNTRNDRLLCPSLFSRTRAITNVIETTGIWLDNDKGGMSPEQFADLFPDLRMVAFNTFSTTDTVRKYRVFIPTDHTMTAELYGLIVKRIIAQVNAVYPEHGFDLNPTHAAALFYLPCQAHQREASFFHDYAEPPRMPLEVMAVGREAALAAVDREPIYTRTVPRILTDKARQLRIERALTKWRNASHADGEDHLGFFLLGVRLMRGAECDDAETARILAEEAHLSHNPSKRKKQIPDIIKQVRSKHS